jgi:hypothetical protein
MEINSQVIEKIQFAKYNFTKIIVILYNVINITMFLNILLYKKKCTFDL